MVRTQIRGPAAMAATDLKHPLAAETICLSRRAVVELDRESLWLVGVRQWHCHRRIFLVAVAE